jgi:hypothetical protein
MPTGSFSSAIGASPKIMFGCVRNGPARSDRDDKADSSGGPAEKA